MPLAGVLDIEVIDRTFRITFPEPQAQPYPPQFAPYPHPATQQPVYAPPVAWGTPTHAPYPVAHQPPPQAPPEPPMRVYNARQALRTVSTPTGPVSESFDEQGNPAVVNAGFMG